MDDILHLHMNFPVVRHGRHISGMPVERKWCSERIPYRSYEQIAEAMDASAERAKDRLPSIASAYHQIAAAIRDGHHEGIAGEIGWCIEVFWSESKVS